MTNQLTHLSCQDDVNARLEASGLRESFKVETPKGEPNPAEGLGQDSRSESGLAKLDAGRQEDTQPVEDKVEMVAGALGDENESSIEAPVIPGPSFSNRFSASRNLNDPMPIPVIIKVQMQSKLMSTTLP